MFSKIRVIPAVAIFMIAAQSPAQVARVFLSGTGDDANTCSNQATPCRSLAMAVTQCPAKGEIIVLTSGGFGSATITKALTINAASGVVAFNARTINVTISTSDPVVIRGLSMQGSIFGDSWGIDFAGGGTLIVENSIFDGFAVGGIRMTAPSTLLVNNCEFRNGGGDGIVAAASTTDVNHLTVQNSRFINNAAAGFELGSNTLAVIKNSVITGNRFGVFAVGTSYGGDPKVMLDTCVIAHNNTTPDAAGIRAQDFASMPFDVAVRVTNCEIYGNTTGLFSSNAAIVSYGTNYLWDNATAGAFSSTVPRQ